jgi:periplasmic divalent cation tolerance protein
MSEVVVVLSTVPDNETGETIARTLVDERLAACVNLLPPMTSIYRWTGAVERDTERQLLIKTTRDRVPAIETRLRQLHSYDLPELIVIDATGGSAEYLAWVASSVNPQNL